MDVVTTMGVCRRSDTMLRLRLLLLALLLSVLFVLISSIIANYIPRLRVNKLSLQCALESTWSLLGYGWERVSFEDPTWSCCTYPCPEQIISPWREGAVMVISVGHFVAKDLLPNNVHSPMHGVD